MPKTIVKSYGFYLFLLSILFVTGAFHAYRHGIDYEGYEFASLRLWNGTATALYDDPSDPVRSFYYSYFFAFAFLPFALLGKAGRFFFFCLFFASYLKVLHFSFSAAIRLSRVQVEKTMKYVILSGLVLLTTYAINDAFFNLNIGVLLLALILFAYDFREKKPVLSGVLLALAISFKMYPAMILGFFIWEWRWKVLLTSVLASVVFVVGLPIFFNGFENGMLLTSKYFYVLGHIEEIWSQRGWHFDGHVFQNITGTTLRYASLLSGNPKLVLNWVVGICAGFVILFYFRGFLTPRTQRSKEYCEQMFIFALALVPLFIPTSWYNLALFYSPLIALTLVRAIVIRDRVSQVAIAVYSILYCLTTPDLVTRPINEKLCFFSIPFVGIAFLVGESLFREISASQRRSSNV